MTPERTPNAAQAALVSLAWLVRQTRNAQRRAAVSRMPADQAIALQHEERLDRRIGELLGDAAEPATEGGGA